MEVGKSDLLYYTDIIYWNLTIIFVKKDLPLLILTAYIGGKKFVKFDKGPVIIYDQGGGPEENYILREKFSRPTQRADKMFRSPLGIAR